MATQFFTSALHPPCVMNKHSVVGVPNGHEFGCDYYSASFETVPLKQGMLDLRIAVEQEAHDAGYSHEYVSGEKVWRKPNPQAVQQ